MSKKIDLEKLEQFLRENKITSVNSKDIIAEIYNEDSPESFSKFISKFTSFVRNEKDLKEFLQIMTDLWNNSPHKSLGGKSPSEVARGIPGANKNDSDWEKISDVLLSIQGEFQKEIYKIIDKKPMSTKETVTDYIHLLFQRYFYTALKNKYDSVSYADMVSRIEIDEKVKIPVDHQLMLRLFKTPTISKDSHRQIRMMMGIENIEGFPLIHDLCRKAGEKPIFYKDEYYLKILAALSKTLGKNLSYKRVLIALWNFILIEWWSTDILLNKIFNLKDFSDLLFSAVENSSKEWSSVDMLFDFFFKQSEKTGFDLKYTKNMVHNANDKFISPENRFEEVQAIMLYKLGNEFCELFLTPLVTYFPILEIHYIDPIDLKEEIDSFEEKDGFGEGFDFWISKPPSEFRLRSMGKKIWQETW